MFQWLLLIIAGYFNEHARKVILYQQEMIRALEAELRGPTGKKRITFPQVTKARIAKLGAELGRETLRNIEIVFSPETILRWNRKWVAKKYTPKHARSGRPRKPSEADVQLICKMAKSTTSVFVGECNGALQVSGHMK